MAQEKIVQTHDGIPHFKLNPEHHVYGGLCSTCIHSSGCTFTRDPDRPVMQCEEFEGLLKVPEQILGANSKLKGDKNSKAHAEDTPLKGLCKLCKKNSTCTYPKPEGGVWHCDEYE